MLQSFKVARSGTIRVSQGNINRLLDLWTLCVFGNGMMERLSDSVSALQSLQRCYTCIDRRKEQTAEQTSL